MKSACVGVLSIIVLTTNLETRPWWLE